MFKQVKTIALIAVLASTAVAVSAANLPTNSSASSAGYSWSQGNFEKVVPLKDGSTLHTYKDGKMAVENAYGDAVSVPIGQAVQAMDGTSIVVSSNEVARLTQELHIHR